MRSNGNKAVNQFPFAEGWQETKFPDGVVAVKESL